MVCTRREFMGTAAGAAGGALVGGLTVRALAREGTPATVAVGVSGTDADWRELRAHVGLDPEYVHMAGLLLSSHPAPVAAAIAEHRRALDRNPGIHLDEEYPRLTEAVRRAAADYLGGRPAEVILTDSTTMGLGLVYNGVSVRADQELLTTDHDFHATHDSLRYKAERSGARLRRIPLYADLRRVSAGEIVERLLREVGPRTRVIAVTWVHSNTGLKIPIREIADGLEPINAGREPADRAMLCADAVHGLGVEAEPAAELGCDVYIAGCHKWLLGPRGTGVVWAHPRVHDRISPTIPSFTPGSGWGGRMSPGGFKPFEHQWALADAFELHQDLGRSRVRDRIHALAAAAKEGLAGIDGVVLHTPMDPALSSGIVCFDLEGRSPAETVRGLRDRGVIASTTPYSPSHARLSPGLLNDEADVERTLAAVRDLT